MMAFFWIRRMVVAVVLAAVGWSLVAVPTASADPAPITLTGPSRGSIGLRVHLVGRLDPGVPGATVVLARWTGSSWTPVHTMSTDGVGGFRVDVTVRAGMNRYRASYVRDDSTTDLAETRFDGVKARAQVALGGARTVRDERSARLTVGWRTTDGRRLTGSVRLSARLKGSSAWGRGRVVRVRAGVGVVRAAPRRDTYYRLRAPATSISQAAASSSRLLDNVPRGAVVRLPSSAPRPSLRLPTQHRAVGRAAHGRIRHISDHRWRTMTGRSWHRGCPVGRRGLRVVTVNYWGFDGYRHRGALVVNRSVASAARAVFADLHRARMPIRRMYPVDRFGWSRRLHGADDYRSMRADNTSAFNCRAVVGRPSARSPHSTGRSIDINTWENPYRSAAGFFPNTAWNSRRTPRLVTYRSSRHPVVRIFRRHGFWWMGSADWQHFQYGGRGHRMTSGPFLD